MKQLVLPEGVLNDGVVTLVGKEFHYLSHVRRLEVGDTIQALWQGQRLRLRLEAALPASLVFSVQAQLEAATVGLSLTLFPCLLKARKLDDVIRQAAEAGVQAIVPVEGDHSISRLEDDRDTDKKLARWQTIAREAAQQCGSASVCEIHRPVRSLDLPAFWNSSDPVLFFHQAPLAKASLHRYLSSGPTEVGLIIGPEGGLSEREVAVFQNGGFSPAWLGETVLRAETAAIYAVAAVKLIFQERSEWTILT